MHVPARTGKVVGIVTFVAICLTILVWLYFAAGGRTPGTKDYEVTVRMPDGFQLVQNADVRAAGAKVGRVEDLTNDGTDAKIRISIKKEYAPLYKNATIRLRTKTLVGENYLDLNPGTDKAEPIADGGVLPLKQAGDAVQLDQILTSVDKPTRAAIQRLLDASGSGLKGRDADLNRLFGQLNPTVDEGNALLRLLDRQSAQVTRLVDNAGRVFAAFGNRTDAVRSLATGVKATADAAASRDAQLRTLFTKLPGTLKQTQETTKILSAVSRRATPIAADLKVGMQSLPPVTKRLKAATNAGERLFDVLPSFSRRADPMLASLESFSTAATPLLTPVDGVLRQANPILRYTAPYAEDMATMFANQGSATSSRDSVGNLLRVQMVQDAGTVTGLPRPVQDLLTGLIAAGGVGQEKGRLRLNAYPKPGTRDNPQPGDGSVPKLSLDPSVLGPKDKGDD